MMRNVGDRSDDTSSHDDEYDTDEDLFSPVQGRRSSLHDFLTPASRETATPPPTDSLPRLQDTSWIGAQVSPIPAAKEEEEDNTIEDEEEQEPIRIAVPNFRSIRDRRATTTTTTVTTTTVGGRMATERTSLLGKSRRQSSNRSTTTSIHQRNTSTNQNTTRNAHNALSTAASPPVRLEEGQPAIPPLGAALPPPPLHDNNNSPTNYRGHRASRPLQDLWRAWITGRRHHGLQHQQHHHHSQSYYRYIPLVLTTTVFLSLVALHDAFLGYLAWRRGVATTYPLAWSWPWLNPSTRSLLRFGAYYYNNYESSSSSSDGGVGGEWWRLVSASLWVTTSVTEWVLLLVAWTWGIHGDTATSSWYGCLPDWMQPKKFHQQSLTFTTTTTRTPWQSQWPVVYVLSVGTGIMWMMAFGSTTNVNSNGDTRVVVAIGCTGWGTAGVLCAKGMQWPQRRFELFVLAIGLVLLNALGQPSSQAAVWGAIGATFFGWAYASIFVAATAATTRRSSSSSSNNSKYDMGVASSWHYYYDVGDGNFKEAASKPDSTGWTVQHAIAAIVTLSMWLVPALASRVD